MSVGGIVIGGVMCLLGTGLFVGGVRKLLVGSVEVNSGPFRCQFDTDTENSTAVHSLRQYTKY